MKLPAFTPAGPAAAARRPAPLRTLAAVLGLLACALPAGAQYKILGADGRVTYTDRPPADTSLNVTPIGRTPGARAAAAQPAANLPIELRQLAQRFPVTLYTSDDCPACDSGRQWLQQRGVPYRERRIGTEADAQALTGLVGGRTVPALTIGAQALRGFSETDWGAYIDAAGYPRDNRLPRGWQPPAPTALVEQPPRPAAAASAVASNAPAARRPAPPPPPPPPVPEGGLRF